MVSKKDTTSSMRKSSGHCLGFWLVVVLFELITPMRPDNLWEKALEIVSQCSDNLSLKQLTDTEQLP